MSLEINFRIFNVHKFISFIIKVRLWNYSYYFISLKSLVLKKVWYNTTCFFKSDENYFETISGFKAIEENCMHKD